jgi:hypothetical protein
MSKILPGLSLQKILSDVGSEVQHMGSKGSHELAAALFHGSAFVMYPRAGKEGQSVEDPQQALPQKEQEMGGREM